MPDTRFFTNKGPFTLGELAEATGTTLSDPEAASRSMTDVAPLDKAGPEEISFLDNRKYVDQFKTSKAGACIVHPDMVEFAPQDVVCLIADLPHKAYALAAQKFYPVYQQPQNHIAPSAVIDPTAQIGDNCRIDANVVIEEQVTIGDNCHIRAGAVIHRGVEIGEQCVIGSNTTLSHCILGNRVTIYPGAQIGQRGFGFAIDPAAGFFTVPQLGRVIIGDDVEIGANSTVDRGAGPDTIIGNGTRLDNLVQIGHNVEIGQYCVMAGQAGIAGSTKLGDFVMVGGQAALAGHLNIGAGAQIAGKSGIMRDVEAGANMMGYPAMPIKQFFKQTAVLNKLTKKRKK